MDKFRDVIMKLSENSSPKQKSFIEEHLAKFFADFNTPDHPPYAAVIYNSYMYTCRLYIYIRMYDVHAFEFLNTMGDCIQVFAGIILIPNCFLL